MPERPPHLNAHKNVTKVLEKIKSAKTPPRFTQDYLATVLKMPGGSAKPVIPLLKKLGFLSGDGVPTARYKSFRNPDQSGSAAAEAIREAYAELFKRNEYAHELPKDKLKNLVVEVTGLEPDSSTVNGIVGTFENLKKFASFDDADRSSTAVGGEDASGAETPLPSVAPTPPRDHGAGLAATRLGITYQINLQLPESDDPAVFNAMFKALREHLIDHA